MEDGDCLFAWEDVGEHVHYCVLSDTHQGAHICNCGERHDTGHEVD